MEFAEVVMFAALIFPTLMFEAQLTPEHERLQTRGKNVDAAAKPRTYNVSAYEFRRAARRPWSS
jgi:hypothetical protein